MQTRQPLSSDPHPIEKVLQDDTLLKTLCKKAKQIQCANSILAQFLPMALHQHCSVANFQNAALVLHTDNAAWATQLRYQQASLTKAFQQNSQFTHIQTVKICVRIPELPTQKIHRPAHMTLEVGELIKNAAASVTHPALKEALLRLSKNGKKKDG